MLGAASPFLPLPAEELRETVGELFRSKGEKVADANRKAFDPGRDAALAKAQGAPGRAPSPSCRTGDRRQRPVRASSRPGRSSSSHVSERRWTFMPAFS